MKPNSSSAALAPLTQTQANVICDLLRGRTITEAARNAGIHRSAIHRWLQQSEFRQAFECERRAIDRANFLEISALLLPATQRLRDAIESPKTSGAAVLRIVKYLHSFTA